MGGVPWLDKQEVVGWRCVVVDRCGAGVHPVDQTACVHGSIGRERAGFIWLVVHELATETVERA